MAHTEDISPGLKECGVLVHGDIYKDDDEKELVESFTEYLTAGNLYELDSVVVCFNRTFYVYFLAE